MIMPDIIIYNDWSRFLAGVNAVTMTVSKLWYIIITFSGGVCLRAALDGNINGVRNDGGYKGVRP